MDKIQFQCSGCGNVLNAPADRAGKNGKCPSCGGAIQVPHSPDCDKRNPAVFDDGCIVGDRPVTLACPQCASPLQVTRQLAGKMARCNKCRALLSISADPLKVIAVGESPRPTSGVAPVGPAPTKPAVPRVPPGIGEPSRGAIAIQIPCNSGHQDGSSPSDLPKNAPQGPTTEDKQDKEKTSQPSLSKIDFACPGCGRSASAPCSMAGKTGTCPSCGDAIQIPQVPDYYKTNLMAACAAIGKAAELRDSGEEERANKGFALAETWVREVLQTPCLP